MKNNQRIICGEKKKRTLCATAKRWYLRIVACSLVLYAWWLLWLLFCLKVLNMFNVFPSAVKTYCCVYNRNWRSYSWSTRMPPKMHNAELDWNDGLFFPHEIKLSPIPNLLFGTMQTKLYWVIHIDWKQLLMAKAYFSILNESIFFFVRLLNSQTLVPHSINSANTDECTTFRGDRKIINTKFIAAITVWLHGMSKTYSPFFFYRTINHLRWNWYQCQFQWLFRTKNQQNHMHNSMCRDSN